MPADLAFGRGGGRPAEAGSRRATAGRGNTGAEACADAGAEPKRRGYFAAAGKALNLVVLMILVFAALVLIVVPRATGSEAYTVLTNSMAPKFPPGTFLVIKPADFSELKYGDVVTFQMYSGRPDVETHRIVGFGATQEGEKTLITKGDNNGVNDADPVRELQVKGKLFYAVPFVGYAANALGNADRNTWSMVAAAGLIGYGALQLVKGIRSRRRTQQADAGALA
ncbi:signal peptidase I [Arthrobacter sp. CDRTa11]|uniref:signal peptidase I n=1 Tax=Arthrobacter sp. CDRTa11 TaxID=2651199 RepID=UPI0022658EF8|nr:signal peptidase I [Arthrobacter sp. CDRTa11]UZX04306.1 signal peptidase I [Arthrobacter sp. CDRTa11]